MGWQKGHSGNPNGRPRGTRDKITQAFLNDLEADWRDNGKAALEAARAADPCGFVRIVASLMPKDVNLNHNVSEAFARALERISAGTVVDESLGEEPGQSVALRDGSVAGNA